ncbi:MAG: hypothetical protein WBB48_08505 [Thermodesulfobacteriota bacterium]
MTAPPMGTPAAAIQDKPLSVKDWLITIVVLMIPFIGLIFLLYWALSNSSNINRKNYCVAYIIFQIAFFVLTLLIVILLVSFGIFAGVWGEYAPVLHGTPI